MGREKLHTFCNTGQKVARLQKISDSMAVHEKCKTKGLENGRIIKGTTEWICCKCNRWFHKVCTGLNSFNIDFCCAKVDIKCLPRSEITYKDVKQGKQVIDEMEKSKKEIANKQSGHKRKQISTEDLSKRNRQDDLNKMSGTLNEFDNAARSATQAPKEFYGNVKKSNNMIVCCVCLKIVYTKQEMDQHWSQYHHITK